jgi:hypothetical protein
VSGANLLSWFALGILAAAPAAVLVPGVGMTLAFLVTLVGLLAALSAHAVAEDRRDGAAVVRVAAAYLLAAVGAAGAGLWWMPCRRTVGRNRIPATPRPPRPDHGGGPTRRARNRRAFLRALGVASPDGVQASRTAPGMSCGASGARRVPSRRLCTTWPMAWASMP